MIFADNMKFERNREIVQQEMRAIQNACRKEKRVDSIWSNTRGKINKPETMENSVVGKNFILNTKWQTTSSFIL